MSFHRTSRRHLHLEPLEDRLCLSNVTVVATGLEAPRGLTFGPDGLLYVAEGGRGGIQSTVLQDPNDQVPGPVGPYTGGSTARISKIDVASGTVTTVADGLPSSQTQPMPVPLVSGVADVKFLNGTLYALTAGAGVSHGLAGTDNGILRVNPDGSTTMIADLSAFQRAHPVANPDPLDFEPDGTWYSMVAVRGAFYAVEPNHQELDKITPDGRISRVVDLSVLFPGQSDWVGPTSLAYHGTFYVGTLGMFPSPAGAESIYHITPSGQVHVAVSGLSKVLGVAFDPAGVMYALESSTADGFPVPFTGKVVRVNDDGSLSDIATGLAFPTSMTFGPDGALYVSNEGFGFPTGEILRIDLGSPANAADVPVLMAAPSGGLGIAPAATPETFARDLEMHPWVGVDSPTRLATIITNVARIRTAARVPATAWLLPRGWEPLSGDAASPLLGEVW
jgi:glucose/arabinose dehydrogenase